jgi:thiamine-monophosphate kinase
LEFVLSGGDDYELVFTAPPHRRALVQAVGLASNTPVTWIGSVCADSSVRLIDGEGRDMTHPFTSFDHFA